MHSVTLTGKVLRTRRTKDGNKVAIVRDSHSYNTFVIPDRNYIKDQDISFEGRIVEVERGSGYIRLVPLVKVE